MKNLKKSLFLVLPLLLVGCGEPKTREGVAYSVASSGNLIKVELKVENEKISEIKFHETQLGVTNFAKATKEVEGATQLVITTSWGQTSAAQYPNFYNYDGTVYEAKVETTETGEGDSIKNQTISYVNGDKDVDTEISKLTDDKQEDLAKLFTAMVENTMFGCDKDGKNIDVTAIYDKASDKSSYWLQNEANKLGWKGNIDLIEKALVGKDPSKVVVAKSEETKTFTVDGVDTGATISYFEAYVGAAKLAFAKK